MTSYVGPDVDGLWVVYRFGGGGGAVGQLGFALLVTGAVRNKSAASVMLLHVVAPCVVGLCYFLFGFAMAFGSTPDANNRTVGAQAGAVCGGGGAGGRGGEVEGGAETGSFLRYYNLNPFLYPLWFFLLDRVGVCCTLRAVFSDLLLPCATSMQRTPSLPPSFPFPPLPPPSHSLVGSTRSGDRQYLLGAAAQGRI